MGISRYNKHKKYKHLPMIFVYSAAHFAVDFACAFLMFRSISQSPDWYLCILLYNFCAFAMQMPMGILADKLNRNFLFAAIGCIAVAAAYGFGHNHNLVAAAVIIGLGNGMFHIGGGIDILNISEEKSGALGIFVSPGAFGVYFGTILGKGTVLPFLPVILTLIISAGLIFAVYFIQFGAYLANEEFSLEKINSPQIFASIICLFLVVCLRSYVGLALNFPWKSSGYWGILLVCAVVFGKIAGGFAADRFGAYKTAFFSLGIAAVLYLFPKIPAAGILAVLLFNMTMPVTLWLMSKIFPKAKGFSFGLLTFALFIGFLPVHFGAVISSILLPTVFAVISIILLWIGMIMIRKAKT